MKCLDFDWRINEFMVYCHSTQLREKSMVSYEQALRLFEGLVLPFMATPLKVYFRIVLHTKSKEERECCSIPLNFRDRCDTIILRHKFIISISKRAFLLW